MIQIHPSSASTEVKPPKDKRKLQPLFPPVPSSGFNFGVAAGRLVPLRAAALLLNRSRLELTGLIDEGRLRWVFDIRAAGAGRGEGRVLGQSLMEFAGLCPTAWLRRPNEEEEFLQVANLILPPGISMKTVPASAATEKVLRGTEIAQCFSCGPAHVKNLIAGECLQTVHFRRASTGTPLVLRASVVKFLKSRRVV